MARVFLAVGTLTLCACRNMPAPDAPPEQRVEFNEFRTHRISRTVNMDDPEAMQRVVSDILVPADGWTWTGKHPTVKVRLRGTQNVQYVADLAIAEATFKTTGPVEIRFEVNGHELERVRFTAPGKRSYVKDVPAAWLLPGQDNIVSAEIDKMWTSPGDGAKLGFILTKIGLTEE